ncbi:hypothetical protein Hanom_Chr02g00147111 [Helianthus anomalus]
MSKSTEDHFPLMPRSLDFTNPPTTIQHSKASGFQYQGGSSGLQYGSSAITQPQGSYFQPQGSSYQHQGSFSSSGGYMGTLSYQVSYPQHQGSSSHVQGSMEYPPRPSAPMYPGSNIFQDQGSLGSQQPRSSKIHVGDFIPMQIIASSGPTLAPEMAHFGHTSGIPISNQSEGNTFNKSYGTHHGLM